MTDLEYKTVAAPQRAAKKRGIKGKDALFAHTVQDLIQKEATGGWRYLRTDHFPVSEGGGLFSKPVMIDRAVMIFARQPRTAARHAEAPAPASQPAIQQPAMPAPARPTAQPDVTPPVGSALRD